MDLLLLHVRQAAVGPAPGLRLTKTPVGVTHVPIAPAGRWQKLMAVVMKVPRQRNLLQVVRTLCPPSSLTRGLNGRQQECHKNANDCDHDQKLDQGKTLMRWPRWRPPDAHDHFL